MIKQDKERQRQTFFVAKKREKKNREAISNAPNPREKEKLRAFVFFQILFLTPFESKKEMRINNNFFYRKM